MRTCQACGQTYYRRNLLQVWDVRQEGSRTGWHQATIRVCLRCQSPTRTARLVILAQTAGPRPQQKQRKVG